MEKLKNLVNPGSKEDDKVMYNTGTAQSASGQASHFGDSRTAGQDPLSTSSNMTGTSQHDTATTGGTSHGLSEPYASRMPGAFDDDDDAATTASVSSGIPGHSQSRSTIAGPNDAAFTEKLLPHEPASETGIGHGQSSLTGNSYPDRSIESKSRRGDHPGSAHLSRDAALGTGAVGSSAHHHESQRGNYASETDRSFPLKGSSPSDNYGPTNAGPHSSSLANKADPRVDSDGSHTPRNTGHGSTADGYGSTTTGSRSLGLASKADPRVDSDGSRTAGNTGYGSTSAGYGSSTGVTPGPANQASVGRDTLKAGAVGSSSTRGIGYGPESWQHEHRYHGHQYEGDPCQTGVGSQEGPHFVSGPHVTDTANRLDPHVSSGLGGSATTGNSSGHNHHGHHGDRDEEAALASGAGAAGLRALEADHRKQHITGHTTTSSRFDPSNTDHHSRDPTGAGAYNDDRSTTTGVSPTGKTAGPHKSDMLNKLDPRVDSDLSKQQGSHGSDHHYGRDAALTGVGGAGMYEAEKHHRGNESNLATSTTLDIGGQSLYGSGVEPRMDATRSGLARDESAVSTAGSGNQPASVSDHHYKGDAGLVGAGGIGAYEASKHHGSSDHSDLGATPQDRLAGSGHQPATATQSSSHPSSSYSNVGQPQSDFHTRREPLTAGALGAGATGGEDKAHNMREYGRSGPKTHVREHQHHGASIANYPSPADGNDSEKGQNISHHKGRDAALVGAGAGAGAGALAGHEESQKDTTTYENEPYQDNSQDYHSSRDAAAVRVPGSGATPREDLGRKQRVSQDTAAHGGAGASAGALATHAHSQRDAAGYGTEPYQGTSREHNYNKDAAILSGAAGPGGLAGHEYSEKDASKSQKEYAKEEKALEKERSKEVKHHNKELAKAEKAHDKAMDKSEKKHEKAIEEDQMKQEHGEKKHSGILGFLHRDKPDKEQKEEEARRQGATHLDRGEEGTVIGTGTSGLESRSGYDPLQGEHGSQSGVHDSPIGMGSGLTTHDAYGAHDSGHNKLHKDPPSKVVESRGYEFQ